MPSAYTSLLGLVQPVTGELSGTWGSTVNDYLTAYLDSAVAGVQTISGSLTAVTLSVANGSSLVSAGSTATGSAQYMIINCTGNPASLLTITAPAASKMYVVINATTTSVSVKLVGVGPTTGVTMVTGEKAVCAWNGTDFVKVASSVVSVSSATGILPAANGGTGIANNSASTITISGAYATTLTVSGATSVTLPTTGTLSTLAGTETLTNKTLTAPVISSISNTGTLTLPTSTDTLVGKATTDTLTNKTLTNPTVTNYVETAYTANSSTAITLSLANGTVQIITLTGNATITMPAVGAGKSFTILLKQDATGSRTVTWTTVSWPSATAPTITSTASKMDKFVFTSDGTSWFGSTAGQNYT